MKKRLLFLAAFAAAPVLFAGCEGDTVGEPSPTSDFPLCEGNKSDDPSCPISPSGEDASSTDAEGSQPDTAPSEPTFPKCSKVELPFPTGAWIKCNTAPRCQIEWHNDPKWGCVASCWEIPNSPPPAIEDFMPQDFGTFTQCQPSP